MGEFPKEDKNLLLPVLRADLQRMTHRVANLDTEWKAILRFTKGANVGRHGLALLPLNSESILSEIS